MTNIIPWPRRVIAATTALALVVSQLVIPTRSEASHLGSSTASAGSAPPPSVSAIQSFQPDLFTGRATTAIPIAVPPGRKGMQPSLALGYSSSGRNSWLGVGWSLDLGYIERSTKNGVPKYDASDSFTFMFQGVASDLVKIPDRTYRAKDEGLFLRFEDKGVSGWEVRDKSGTRYLFGQTSSSQVIDAGRAFRWCLDNVIDVNGNSLSITYAKDQNQLYPAQIRYTAHEPTGLIAANQVNFELENRPDADVSYRAGFEVRTAKRLKAIEAKATVGGTLALARRYALTYTISARTARSLLQQVTQFGSDGITSLPATTFTYQDTGGASYPNMLNNMQPLPSQAAWNVRKAALDTGHETWGCAQPYHGLPWGSPSVSGGGFDLGCVSGSVSGNGDVTMSGCNDHFGHVWTYVYVSQAKTISLSHSNSSDAVGCLYREDAGGVSHITSSGSIALQAGWSILHITAYHQHQGWGPTTLSGGLKNQVEVMNPSQITLGVPQLAGDVNGDAKTDIIKFNPSNGSWTVSCGTSCTLSPGGPWLPSGFGTSSSTPLLGDWNADGRTDIAVYSGGSWQFATSTGTSFQTGTVSSLSLGSGTPLTGDFNSDGITDIGTYNNGAWSFAFGTGSSFNTAVGALNLSWGGSNTEPLTGDFNGDGLTDIGLVDKSTGSIDIRLSRGTTWTAATNWIGSFGGASPHSSADFNGDGLTDALYHNRSAGQVIYAPSTGSGFGSPITLPLTFALTSPDDTIQIGDFNGDGLSDPAVFNMLSGSSQLALSSLTNPDGSNGTAVDALRTIQNGLGGRSTLSYQPSTLCGCDEESLLPFVLQVVQNAKQEDGLGNSYTTTYLFHGGLYDAPTREFRGFEEVKVFDANGNKSVTHFHQDDAKKGRPFLAETRDQYDQLWTKSEHTWTSTEPYPGVRFVKLDQTDAYLYDGDSTFRQVRSRVEYDAYGNVTAAYEDGEPTVTGDERSSRTTFTPNTTAWILNKPSLTQTLNGAGTIISQRRFTYDAASNLSKEEEWLTQPGAQSPEQWLATQLSYDAYGNVTSVIDALNRTTTNTYDATGTYLTRIANTLGHARQLAYDARTGQVTSSTDQNGVATTTEYDALGRVTNVIGPNDTSALPTMSYEYDLSTVPAKTVTHARIQSGSPLHISHYTFHDGLGRTIQTRSPAEDPTKQVVGGAVEFNTLGQVVKQWVPYLDEVSSSYRPQSLVSGLTSPVSYTYDAAGRPLTTTDPDGTVTSTSYDDWSVTSTDANGHQTRRASDSFGRLAKVEEFNGTDTYTTTYEYDTLNNLVNVTDAQSNVTTISYDSLGRKVSMNDPDMGVWSYAYDAVDNLTSQTDARGVTTAFTYDLLNRLTRKEYIIPPQSQVSGLMSPVSYTYDNTAKPFSKGKLTEIADGSGSSGFEYDKLGRLIKESKTVDGTTHTIQRAYDLLGRLVSLTYPDGESAAYTYNAQGGIESVSLQSPVSGLLSVVSNIDYNAAGQLTKIAYGNGVVTDYTYDPQTLRLGHLATSSPGHGTLQDFSYAFDAAGNVTSITDAVHTGSQSFQYDPLNRLTRATGAYGTLTYAYDPIGNMTEKEGVTMTYGAGSAGPHAVTSSTAAGSTAVSLTYDQNGNMVEKNPCGIAGVSCPTAQTFSYDAENRLVEVKTAQEESVSVTFKPGWNFFSLPVIPEDGAIVALLPSFAQDFEQIARWDSATGPLGHFSHYVGNPIFDDFTELEYGVGYEVYAKREVTLTIQGKLPSQQLSKSLGAGWHLLPAISTQPTAASTVFGSLGATQVLAYEPAAGSLQPAATVEPGQAYYVQLGSAKTWTPPVPKDPSSRYVYDGDGGKVKQTTASGTTTYLGEVYEKSSDGKIIKSVYAGSLRIATKHTTDGLRFIHGDHLGSSNVVTDGTGALVEHTEHTPYGAVHRVASATGPLRHPATPFGFTGQRQDTGNTGLILFPARAYDPELGRFLQADPFVQDPADPQSLNRYSYARNNPINLVDPTGHFWFIPFIIAAVKAAVVGAIVGAAVSAGVAAITGGDVGKAALAGAAGGAILGVGAAAAGAAFSGSTISAIVGRASVMAGAGALGGTASAAVSGGSLGRGAAFGALGAGAFSLVGSVPFPNNAWGAIGDIGLSATVGGGISKLAGGEFWQGAAVGGTLASGRQLYRAALRWDNQRVADPSLRTSDGTWGPKDGFRTHGTGSLKSDVGIALITDAKPGPFGYLASERSLPLRALSRIVPALDPMAEMHDPFVHQAGRILPGFSGPLYNQATIPLAYGVTVAGALYQPPLVGGALGSYNYDNE